MKGFGGASDLGQGRRLASRYVVECNPEGNDGMHKLGYKFQ